ncbi:hypothetical protein SBY92_001238 [Candida maltosa Xu316]
MKHTPYNPHKYSDRSNDVITLRNYFHENKLPVPSNLEIISILKSPFTQGDLNKSYYLIRMFQLSCNGLFLTNSKYDKLNNSIQFLGAENWDNVMCYLDALLFAMFANLESFEPILFIPNHSDYLINQLSALLRVYVSLLRSGNLITTDLTAKVCEALMKLGFKEALSHRQQDAATLFEFLTSTLNMPLLTFKIDIRHGGKYNKKDDEKLSKERILFVSIPNDEESEKENVAHDEDAESSNKSSSVLSEESEEEEDSITLEECLEHYFNNSISVKRELERRATLSNITEDKYDDEDDGKPRVVETTFSDKYDFEKIENINKKTLSRSDSLKSDGVRVGIRPRSSTLSIWSLNNETNENSRRGSVSGKEVSLPAWMFLRLLPFYTDDNVRMDDFESIAKTSKEFATRRPILPICLKRYRFNSGASSGTRSKKRIIIPPFIALPEFVADDIDDSSCSFRLVLESAICHRGDTIESGHFVAAVRKNTNVVDETEEEANAACWYLYDDMHKSARVVEKTFKDIFKSEWPYMLFYRLVRTDDISAPSSSINSPVVRPQGSKSQYWEDSSENSLTIKVPPQQQKPQSHHKSVPISSKSPIDPKYVDIRNKYYWYFTDAEKHYFKEEVSIRDGSSSLTLSPQFRRNSQWSVGSNISTVHLDKPKSDNSKQASEEKLIPSSVPDLENSSHSSLWKRPFKMTSPTIKVDSAESVGELHKQISPINLDSKSSVLPKTLRNLEDHQRKHRHRFHGKRSKRGDDYKKEHCIIM